MEIEKEQLGVPKSVRRRGETLIFEDVLKMSADIEKKENTGMCKSLWKWKRTKVAYVCHFRAFQDRNKSPIPRIIHRQNGGGYGGGKARLVWTSRAKRLFLKMSADIEKSRTQACVKVCESRNARKLHTYATFVLSKTERFPAYPASSIENAKNSMEIATFSIFPGWTLQRSTA